ncbi:vacuolar protein sorting-associated protein 26C [Halyomorpha halys]|uniref:vacuolar protein sorting-associated protein 26C n=1 Tax=Halyomorpha halys TaxID=286706 RepID=UPI0006D4E38D|nr:Down syndrome critical region protein 3 homolog isoform X2 [Halyomorpha halys]
MNTSIDIRVKKANKIYHEGDSITGTIVIQTPGEIKHEGITLTMEGLVELQLSPRNVGIFEAFYNSVKPVQICHVVMEISGPGKIPSGKTDIPFEVPLLPRGNKTIYETYHGVFVYIQYTLKCDLKRGFLAKSLMKMAEFIVEYKSSGSTKAVNKKVDFVITPESLEGPRDLGTIPRFKISGLIDSVVCCISKPFTGQIKIEHTEIPIKSIELQLVRVETCGCAEGYAKDVTEIQSIQIGEGNVATNLYIPIYMIFPRLFTCPTLITTNFKVEFEINIVVVFENDHLVSENFPIVLTRA